MMLCSTFRNTRKVKYTLQISLAQKIQKTFIENKWTLAIAESCTGGYISNFLTDIPGSSLYFKGSIVAYSNELKTDWLKIPSPLIKKYGAVSKEAVVGMAKGLRKKTKATWNLSVTGIAGPGGETKEKPVGLVYAAVVFKDEVFTVRFNFSGGRMQIKKTAARSILEWLLKVVNGIY